jgi:hypothetical protein
MLSVYSNYDYREVTQLYPEGRGALKANQQFIPNGQLTTSNSYGLLIIVKTDVIGTIYVEFTNIKKEPYDFTQIENITTTKILQVPIKAKYFRVRFVNDNTDQSEFILNTYILNVVNLMSGIDSLGNGYILQTDDTGSLITKSKSNTILLFSGNITISETSSTISPEYYGKHISIYGTSDSTNNLTVQYSGDNTIWFNSTHVIACNSTDFNLDFICSAKYIRLINDTTASVTCYISLCF